MQLSELFEYKNKLMRDLCSDTDVVRLVTDKPTDDLPDVSLPYTQIYPYEFIPETVDHGQTFICFDVDIISVPNKTFVTPAIFVWAFTHKSKMRLDDGGVRVDALAVAINKILNGSRVYGLGELDLADVGRFSPIKDYQGRVLTYYTSDFNRPGTSKNRPRNRRDA